MGVGRIFSGGINGFFLVGGATLMNYILLIPTQREKHFPSEKLIAKYQILISRGLGPPCTALPRPMCAKKWVDKTKPEALKGFLAQLALISSRTFLRRLPVDAYIRVSTTPDDANPIAWFKPPPEDRFMIGTFVKSPQYDRITVHVACDSEEPLDVDQLAVNRKGRHPLAWSVRDADLSCATFTQILTYCCSFAEHTSLKVRVNKWDAQLFMFSSAATSVVASQMLFTRPIIFIAPACHAFLLQVHLASGSGLRVRKMESPANPHHRSAAFEIFVSALSSQKALHQSSGQFLRSFERFYFRWSRCRWKLASDVSRVQTFSEPLRSLAVFRVFYSTEVVLSLNASQDFWLDGCRSCDLKFFVTDAFYFLNFSRNILFQSSWMTFL